MLDLLFATIAAALPLVQADPAPPTELRSIAAQIDARPQGVVRLQCRIYADTNRAERCVAVAPDEILDDAAFDARSRDQRPAFGTLADVAIRLTERRNVSVTPSKENRMVSVERQVDFAGIPVTPPSGQPPLTPRTAAIAPGPGFSNPAAYYPATALHEGAEGRVEVTCRIRDDHRFDCFRARIDRSGGYGFSSPSIDDTLVRATFRMIEESSVAPNANDGTPTAGRDFTTAVRWMLPG